MKRKDWYTLIGAAIFTIIILFANAAVAHDGPEMAQYFQDLQTRQHLADKGKGKKRPPPKPFVRTIMIARL